jgi:hypothetical protein
MTVNSLAGASVDVRLRRAVWYAPLVPIAISIFAVSALVSYHLRAGAIMEARTVAQSFIIGIYQFLGWVPSCMFFGLVLAWSSIWWVAGSIEAPGKKLARVFALTLALAVFGNLDEPGLHTGALGAFLGGGLVSIFGSFLSHLLLAPLTFFALLLATDYFWMSFFERRAFERAIPPTQVAAAGWHTSQDVGVEADVTEEFKSLARLMPATGPLQGEAPHYPPQDVEQALDRFFDGGEAAAVAAEAAWTAALEIEAEDAANPIDQRADQAAVGGEPEEWSRLSYFERRQLRAERDAQRAPALNAAVDDMDRAAVVPQSVEEAAPSVAILSDFDRKEIENAIDSGAAAEADYALPRPVASGSAAGTSDPVPSQAPTLDDDEFSVAAAELNSVAIQPSYPPALRESAAASLDEAASEDAAATNAASLVAAGDDVVRVPVLDESSLRQALGFATDAEAVAESAAGESDPDASESSDGVAPDDGGATEPVRYEVHTEPLFATPAAAFEVEEGADEDADEPASGIDPDAAPENLVRLERPRGFLAPVVAYDSEEVTHASAAAAADDDDGVAFDHERLVAIPRPLESPRQQSLFVTTLDDSLVREAVEMLTSTRRASAAMLQRKLRIDYSQAMELLALLAHRGMLELAGDGTQGRVVT